MIAVLIIDMQNAFFEDPALEAGRADLVNGCNALTAAARGSGVKVLLVKTEHERDGSTWTLNMLDDGRGFLFRGTPQADFIPGLDTAGFPQLTKTRDSAFVGTDLLPRLRNWQTDHIVLAGVSTHNCVAQTGADAYAHNFRVSYAAEANGSEDAGAAESVRSILSREYRQPVLSTAEIRDLFRAPP